MKDYIHAQRGADYAFGRRPESCAHVGRAHIETSSNGRGGGAAGLANFHFDALLFRISMVMTSSTTS